MKNTILNRIATAFVLCLTINSASAQVVNYFSGTNSGSGNSGSYCSGAGSNSMGNGNSGDYNTGFGAVSLGLNTTGIRNTGLGAYSLYNNHTGDDNTATGNYSLYFNSGDRNTANGSYALYNNDIGNYNVAVGYAALYYNESGAKSTAVGHQALYKNQNSNNTAVGYSALFNNEAGIDNTAVGMNSILNNVSGLRNTAVGYDALVLATSGNNSTAIGRRAGYARAKYSNCTFLGAEADATASAFSNSTSIGYQAKVDGSNKVRVGNSNITSIGGQVGWSTLSDMRLKTNITESKLGLDFINQLRPVTYNYKTEGQENIQYTGLIAQEVDAAAKKAGVDFSGVDKNGEYWGVRYGDLSVPLIKGMQEQQSIIKSQQNEIQELRNEIASIKSALTGDHAQRISNNAAENKLEQNSPNPFADYTTIRYSVNSDAGSAHIIIRSLDGLELKKTMLDKNMKSITIRSNYFAQGTYTYTLEVNGKSIDTKLMVITK